MAPSWYSFNVTKGAISWCEINLFFFQFCESVGVAKSLGWFNWHGDRLKEYLAKSNINF